MRIPGAWCLFTWALITAVIPLGLAASALPVEEARFGGPEMIWWLATASVLPAAVAAARYPRGHASLARATTAGLLAATVYVGATAAVYIFVFPMEKHPIDLRILLALGPALLGATAGHFIQLPWKLRRTAARLTAGIAVALLGALLAPGTARDAAQFSVTRWAGPEIPEQQPATFVLPSPGRYTLLADGDSTPNPGCRLAGPGASDVRPLTVQPEEPGYDATPATTMVADVTVAAAGAYALTCEAVADGTDYRLVGEWTISPVADALMRWPLLVLLLIGALPGLAMVAAAVRDQRGASRVR